MFPTKLCVHLRFPISVLVFSSTKGDERVVTSSTFSDAHTAVAGRAETQKESSLDQSQGLRTQNRDRRASSGLSGDLQKSLSQWMPVGLRTTNSSWVREIGTRGGLLGPVPGFWPLTVPL